MNSKPTNIVLSEFIEPYDSSATPYTQSDFDPRVREVCRKDISQNKNRTAKCVLVGDGSVGKTSLIKRLKYDYFTEKYKMTENIDLFEQKFEILKKPFKLEIWDTAGQERFKAMTSAYYRASHCAVIAFDLSKMLTLENATKWFNIIDDTLSPSENPFFFLVGTQSDSVKDVDLDLIRSEAVKIAKKFSAEFWMTSAKSGENVKELFSRIASLTFNHIIDIEMKLKREFTGGYVNDRMGSGIIRLSGIQDEGINESKKKRKCSCLI